MNVGEAGRVGGQATDVGGRLLEDMGITVFRRHYIHVLHFQRTNSVAITGEQ